MKRKQLFVAGVIIAFTALAAVVTIGVLGLETKREVFILWEIIGNFFRGILLVSSAWVLIATLLRWKQLARGWRIVGLSPMISVLGLIALSLALDYARPNVKVYVGYTGTEDGMFIDVTTHYGSAGATFKPGEERLVCEGRGFPKVLNVAWGTNYTRAFSRAFDLKGKIPRFGISETLRVIVADGDAQLEIGSEPGGAANRSQPVRPNIKGTSAAAGSGR